MKMAELYSRIRNQFGPPDANGKARVLVNAQRRWLKERNRCGVSYACLVQAYQDRIQALEAIEYQQVLEDMLEEVEEIKGQDQASSAASSEVSSKSTGTGKRNQEREMPNKSVKVNPGPGTPRASQRVKFGERDFEIYEGYSLEGGDFAVSQAGSTITQDKCAEICGDNSQCVAFTYFTMDAKCALKAKIVTQLRSAEHVVSGIASDQPQPRKTFSTDGP